MIGAALAALITLIIATTALSLAFDSILLAVAPAMIIAAAIGYAVYRASAGKTRTP